MEAGDRVTAPTVAPRDRRAIAVGLLVIGALLLLARGMPAWQRWAAESRSAAAAAVRRAEAAAQLVGGFEEALDSLEARTARLRALRRQPLIGSSPSDLSAQLGAYLGEVSRLSSVRLDAVDLQVDSSGGAATPTLSARLEATSDIVGTTAFLQRLETGQLLLGVRKLTVRPNPAELGRGTVERLNLELTVDAMGLIGAGKVAE
jgi:hypothetical protein